MNQKKLLLKDLSQKASKAKQDGKRGGALALALEENSSGVVDLPEITNLNVPVSAPELKIVCSLAEQLRSMQGMDMTSTWIKAENAGLRVSPLQGITTAEYVASATALQQHLTFDWPYLIKACALLDKEGAHLPLRELWKLSGAPAGKLSSAPKMVDLLMRAPIVAVRVAVGNSFDSSWVVMAKEGGTNYSQLASIMGSIAPAVTTGSATISKGRLKALTRMASTVADRRLIELAALDGRVSMRRARELSGHYHETVADRQQREQQLAAAMETILAYEALARLDTLAEINSLLGGAEITDSDLRREVDKLKAHDEEVERLEEDAMLLDALGSPFVSYQHEEVDKELELEADFHQVVESCDGREVDVLVERLTVAARNVGFEIDLDAGGMLDPAKQEELVQLFGEGWSEALRSCLLEPLAPDDADANSTGSLVDDLDEVEGEHYERCIQDHVEEMVLSVKRDLGVEEPEEAEEGDGSAELIILAQLTPHQLVTKLVARNRRKRARQAARSAEMEAARRGLAGDQRGRAACLDTTLSKWPDIGDKIEAICADLREGADAKRRDGAITLNSGIKRTKGTGFLRIRLELERRHGIELSNRALRDLCVARDRRMKVSQRYKCIVNLKMRRSVKRITQDNIDDHSQNAAYRLLHYLRDRTSFDDTLWFQRDDHAMVRGNSSESTRQHGTATVGEGASALQHDYMNPEISSSLYATSILVSGCADGGAERCLALTKAVKLLPSTPSQHYADFYMLQERARTDDELQPIFFTSSGDVKPKVQLEVDGGSDENPTGRETRFLQAELLMGGPMLDQNQRRAQVGASTRHAGGSALNKVERLNGEMTRAAAVFHAIASDDVVGPLQDDSNGQYLDDQLKAMWAQHAEDYRKVLDRKCGLNDSSLLAFPGATASDCQAAKLLHERRPKLLQLLDPKLPKKTRAEVERSDPVLAAHVKKVLAMQAHCEVLTHYSSCVRVCSCSICPLCSKAPKVVTWYDGGPLLKPVPPSLPDPDRAGHYLEPEAALIAYAQKGYKLSEAEKMAPSERAMAIYEREMGKSLLHFPEAKLAPVAKEINDYRVTVDALRSHFTRLRYIRLRRLEGARKAVETKKKNAEARATAAVQPTIAKAAKKQAAKAAQKAAAEVTVEVTAAETATAAGQPTIATTIATAAKKAESKAAKAAAEAEAAAAAAATKAAAETEAAEAAAAAEATATEAAEAAPQAAAEAQAAVEAQAAEEQAALSATETVPPCWYRTVGCTFSGKHGGPCSTQVVVSGSRERKRKDCP